MTRSQTGVAGSAKDLTAALEGSASAIQEVASSVGGVRKDAEALAASADATAATLEETSRSVKGTAANSVELASACQQLAAAATQTTASVSDAAARGAENATVIEEVATTIEQMSVGIGKLAGDAKQVGERVTAIATGLASTTTSLDTVARDAMESASAIEETSATAEELARSVRGVAELAQSLEDDRTRYREHGRPRSPPPSKRSRRLPRRTRPRSMPMPRRSNRSRARRPRSVRRPPPCPTLHASTASASQQLEHSTRAHRDARRHDARHLGSRDHVGAIGRRSPSTRSIAGLARSARRWLEGSAVMKDMGKRAEEIGDIVQTINLIADRTNLLSLNASIEAARAGEHGRGFAVIAEEIRALADRAAAAAGDVAKIVRGLQTTAREALTSNADTLRLADEGAQLGEDARTGLHAILEGVTTVDRSIREISTASGEQAQAVQTVVQATARLTEESRAIARAGEEQTQATQALARSGAEMRTMAKQTRDATGEQARALRELVKSNGAALRERPEGEPRDVGAGDRRTAARARRRRRCASATVRTTAAMAEQQRNVAAMTAAVSGCRDRDAANGHRARRAGARRQRDRTRDGAWRASRRCRPREPSPNNPAPRRKSRPRRARSRGSRPRSRRRPASRAKRSSRSSGMARRFAALRARPHVRSPSRQKRCSSLASVEHAPDRRRPGDRARDGGASGLDRAGRGQRCATSASRTREIAASVGEQVKTTTASAADVALIVQEIAGVRRSNLEQADQVTVLGSLIDGRNGTPMEEPLGSS